MNRTVLVFNTVAALCSLYLSVRAYVTARAMERVVRRWYDGLYPDSPRRKGS